MLKLLFETAKRTGPPDGGGICGQGPSDFPDFAQFPVMRGIDPNSATPDSFVKRNRSSKRS